MYLSKCLITAYFSFLRIKIKLLFTNLLSENEDVHDNIL